MHVNLTEYSTPYLHIRYLTAHQQSLCEQNPTYCADLASLRALRENVEHIRSLLKAQDVGNKVHELSRDPSRKQRKQNTREIEKDKHQFEELERKMLMWDDELAGLAEGLVSKPKVSTSSSF